MKKQRNIQKLTAVGAAVLGMLSVEAPAFSQSTLAWDKTFPKSERVDHRKISFYNRLGITLVADLYIPKNLDRSRRHAAIVVGGAPHCQPGHARDPWAPRGTPRFCWKSGIFRGP